MTHLVAVVGDHGRPADTVSYALREGREVAGVDPTTVRFLVPVGTGADALPRAAAEALLARVADLAAAEPLAQLTVETDLVAVPGAAPPARVAALVAALPPETGWVVLAPEFDEFDPASLGAALDAHDRADVVVERAPVGRHIRRPPVALASSPRRTVATFGLALGFYLALGDPTSPFDLVTGVVSAGVVAMVLSRVAFEAEPSVASLARAARATLFLPYLLYAVVRANLAMARVILDPRLPIDPRLVRVPAPQGRFARALLANSITLTPGTVTVDVVGDELVVHALTAGSRADLLAGDLARAVAFVVDGRAGARAAPAGGER